MSAMKRAAKTRKSRSATRPSGSRPRGTFASLKVSDAFKAFVLDQLESLGDVVSRPMFGGVGLYRRGAFFGIIARDTLFLKVDDVNRGDYQKAGMTEFNPYADRRGSAQRRGSMSYYAVPVGVLENADELAEWARRSLAAAARKP